MLALLASMALVSCTEFYVKKYESACEDGNNDKAAVYAAKLLGKELSDEQEKRVEEASEKLLQADFDAVGDAEDLDWE